MSAAMRTDSSSGRSEAPARPADASSDGPALRAEMECVVLPPVAGATRSERPPVEIFLGTEPAQYRANRVFGYSIEKVRDPGREVRIHLMSELPGFDRRGWTTGFTNYRFAIPAFCGGAGRAIYNDEDEIYLTDPGVLFDLDLGDAGYLAISDTESSVMLIDCARMDGVWTLGESQRGWKRSLLAKATKAVGVRGDLDPRWNARDEEFEPGRSHLLHYTTLHTQPWRPFPERFVYQEGSYTDLWHALEREAIAQGFDLFRREAPSKAFERLRGRLEALAPGELPSAIGTARAVSEPFEALVAATKSASLVELLPDLRGQEEVRPGRSGLEAERRVGLLEWLEGLPSPSRWDGVVCVDGLESVPVWDVPWLVDSLFARAGRFVFAAVRCRAEPARRFLHPPTGTAFTPAWWRSHFEAAAVRHPEVRWELVTTRGGDFDADGAAIACGGPRPGSTAPRIWTLSGGAGTREEEVEALAASLGGAEETFAAGGRASDPFAGGRAPWPDLLIASGRDAARPARRIRAASSGRCLVVAVGAEAALPIDEIDLALVQEGETLFPHPRRLELPMPLIAPPDRGSAAATRLGLRLAAEAGPKLVLRLELDPALAPIDAAQAVSLGRKLAASADRLRGVVIVSTGPRVGSDVVEAVSRGLGSAAWSGSPGASERAGGSDGRAARPIERAAAASPDGDDGWSTLLAVADVFVVVGPSQRTLVQVVASGRPAFLVREGSAPRPVGLLARLREALSAAVVARAQARPANDRGTTRPQEGLEWLCAKWVEGGRVRVRRSADALARRLLETGHLRRFPESLGPSDLAGFPAPPATPLEAVVARIAALLGVARQA